MGWFQRWGLSDRLPLLFILDAGGLVLAGVAMIAFLRHFVDWPGGPAKRFDIALAGFCFVYLAGYLALTLLSPETTFAYSRAGSALIAVGVLSTAAWASYRRFANAPFFLVAFAPFMLIALARLADSFGFINGGQVVYYFYLFTGPLHALMLMLAILKRETNLRRTQEALEWRLGRMREEIANHALFTRMLAHEVRTPLAIIDNYSQLLARRAAARGDSELQTTGIRSSVRRLSMILDRFLRQDQFSKLIRPEAVSLEIPRLIRETISEVRDQT